MKTPRRTIARARGEALTMVLEELKERGRIGSKNIAELLGCSRRSAITRAHKWCELGWLQIVGRATFAAGWKTLGMRIEPEPLTNEWLVLQHARREGVVDVKRIASIIDARSLVRAFKVAQSLVSSRWLKPVEGGFACAPDPFLTETVKRRVELAVERLRSGELVMQKMVSA